MIRRAKGMTASCALVIVALWALFGRSALALPQASVNERSRKLFTQHCASCHGEDGRGQGPVAAALKVGPPDLTMLQAPGEKFPTDRVVAAIDGQKEVLAHGPRKMPVWGVVFRSSLGERGGQKGIAALAGYIESIQASAK